MTNIPVFLASDDNYAPFIATTIASICDNTKSFIDFYILDGGITEKNQDRIKLLSDKFSNFSIEFITIDLDKEFPNLKENGRISKSTYSRYLISRLKPNLSKVIYSDVDVVALGDIAELYNEDLEEYTIGAVWEEYAENKYNKDRKKILGLSDNHKYFCAGHLLINSKKWNSENILNQLIELSEDYSEILDCADQDVLNKYFDNNYKVLDSKYSYLTQNFIFYNNNDNIIIRHFNGKIKPWHVAPDTKTDLMPNLSDFWNYAKITNFYDDLIAKVGDKSEQSQVLRHLRIASLIQKSNIQ